MYSYCRFSSLNPFPCVRCCAAGRLMNITCINTVNIHNFAHGVCVEFYPVSDDIRAVRSLTGSHADSQLCSQRPGWRCLRWSNAGRCCRPCSPALWGRPGTTSVTRDVFVTLWCEKQVTLQQKDCRHLHIKNSSTLLQLVRCLFCFLD